MKNFFSGKVYLAIIIVISFNQSFSQDFYTASKNESIPITKFSSSASFTQISFVDSATGWIAGYNGLIRKTTTGGAHWIDQSINTPTNFYDICFVNDSVGWVCGDNGIVYKTIDGGNNWIVQTTESKDALFWITFVDPNFGWIASIDSGTILATTNGGSTWMTQNSGTKKGLTSIKFINHNYGWAVGYDGTIIRTTNGGATWSTQTSNTSTHLWGIDFSDSLHGVADGGNWDDYSSVLLHTTDGGITWVKIYENYWSSLFKIDLIDASIGWATGRGGTILKTTDGGLTWTNQGFGGYWLGSLSTVGNKFVWTGDGGGNVVTTTNGGENWSVKDANSLSNQTTGKLIDWWNADGNTDDIIGGNNGVLNNGATFGKGIIGEAFSFDGNDDILTVPDSSKMNFENKSFSISAWVNAASFDHLYCTIISKRNEGGDWQGWSLMRSGDLAFGGNVWRFTFGYAYNNDYSTVANIFSTVPAVTNQFIHLVIAIDRVNQIIRMYVNGKLQSSGWSTSSIANIGNISSPAPLRIGRSGLHQNTQDYVSFTGLIDEIKIFDFALTQTDVDTLYQVQNHSTGALIDYWNADGNADDSVGGNNGILQNGTSFNNGIVGQAFSFDGNDDNVIIPDSTKMNFRMESFTLSAWVNAASFDHLYCTIMSKRHEGGDWQGWWFGRSPQNGGLWRFEYGYSGAFGQLFSDSTAVVGKFTNIVIVVDRNFNSLRMYVNGKLQSSYLSVPDISTIGSINSTAPVRFGGSELNVNTQDYVSFTGLIDEIKIFNFALSQADVDTLYQAVSKPLADPFRILSVMDVPNDQGKQVFVTWRNFELDSMRPFTPLSYNVWRSDNDVWTHVAEVPSRKESILSVVVPTIYDSTIINGLALTTFQVTAHGANDSDIAFTVPLSGYSVDNLCPIPPQSVTGKIEGRDFIITWQPSPDKDFNYFAVYRSTVASFNPSELSPLKKTVGTTFSDEGAADSNYFYRISVFDSSGNESEYSSQLSNFVLNAGFPAGLPKDYSLAQNYPNPFNPSTDINYQLPSDGLVTISIYDGIGRLIEKLVDKYQPAGFYSVTWNAKNISSGLYIYRITVSSKAGQSFTDTKKMTFMK